MVPRANICAIDEDITTSEFAEFYQAAHFSRIPVYRGSLDKITGILHIKDLLVDLLNAKPFDVQSLVREPVIVTPGMPVMDLFLMMREEKRHMAFVVDEHGGIDGLVTINDIIEAIVGDIEDEFDQDDEPEIIEKADGSILADARLELEEFEDRYGRFLKSEERDDVETLGGLAIHIAGRVPRRGESLKHASGVVLDIIEADKRRVSRMRLHNVPRKPANDDV
jgi:CBS domain containing-hemolysin-like protein